MEVKLSENPTDVSLFVETSNEEVHEWDRQRIVDALIKEAKCPEKIAEAVALQVEGIISNSGLGQITSVLIRELVNAKLIESGHGEYSLKHMRFGLPASDVEKIAFMPTKENANVIFSPESTHKYYGDAVSKQYALDYLLPVRYRRPELSRAHLTGDIHIHDLDYFITRPYCSGHDLRYLAKFGLIMDGTGKNTAVAKPAKHADVLILHAAKWLGVNQAYFSGAQAYSFFNASIAPYLTGKSYEEIHQLAQMFIYEMAQMSVARGAQVVFSDLNIDIGIPKVLADVPAIGPKGETVGVYGDYYDESMNFAKALMEVYLKGDARGVPFSFPKPLIKIRKENLNEPGFEDFMHLASRVSSTMGNPYYINQVTYEDENISMCCRLRYKLREEDMDDVVEGRARSSAIQNVTINLPRIAYLANGEDDVLFELIEDRMEWAKQVHEIKKEVIERLMGAGGAPLLAMNLDGYPYLRMNKVRHLIGMLGLNEMVQVHTGKELHEGEEALRFGWKIIKFMEGLTKRFTEDVGRPFALEQTPAESTAYRLAKLDIKYYNGMAEEAVKGDLSSGSVYYTNSTQFNPAAEVTLADKIRGEGLFHPLVEAGALTHAFLGEASPDPEALMKYTVRMLRNTMNQQIAYTRDLTYCPKCNTLHGGLLEACSCGNSELEQWSRITGYLQNVSGWNRGKLEELKDRYRYAKSFAGRGG